MDLMLGDTKFSIKEENIENVIKAFKKHIQKTQTLRLKISTQSKMYLGNLDTMFLQMRMAILQTLIMIAVTCPVDRRSFFHLSQSMLKARATSF